MAQSVLPATEKALLEATRPFEAESRIRSWWYVGSTFIVLGAVLTVAARSSWWPLRMGASLAAGLLLVRTFILFHDFQHGSLLRGSLLARALFFLFGLLALTPPRNWRHTHNVHHAHVGKPIAADDDEFSLVTSDIGSYPLMTTDKWRQASMWQRLCYRITRHPLTILCAYVMVFMGSLCVVPLLKDPRKNWESAASLLAHVGVVAGLWVFAGFPTLFFAFWLPVVIAAALGAYLFFVQHNFPGMRIVPQGEWTHFRGGLESSSFLQLGPILGWFTGNIGYHHMHHLNSRIPFYRLPEAMAAMPELQPPIVTSFRPRDILACLRLNLWDPHRQQLVSYREAASSNRSPAT